MCRKGFLLVVPVLLAVFLAWPAAASSVEEELFSRYFSERVRAESVLPVVSATEEELRRGAVPTLTVCLERAEIGGVAYDRLLLVLSDGKPNDADRYDGRYGVEDMRQSVTEARLQGIFPFCLTVDLQAPGYLPKVFGPDNYAVLSTPARLPLVLLDWTRRLLAR